MILKVLRFRRYKFYGQRHWLVLLLVALFESTLLAGQWNQPGGPGSPLLLRFSYSNLFEGGGLDASIAQHELMQEVEGALTVFTRYVPISFLQSPDDGTANIRIGRSGFGGGTIGVADLPGGDAFTGTLQMWLDDSDRVWSADWPRAVTAHEIGHNLGLEHWEGGVALMNGGISSEAVSQVASLLLFEHDAADIRGKYGTGRGSVRNRRFFLGAAGTTTWDDDSNWWLTGIASPATGPAMRPTTNSLVTISNGSVLIDGGAKTVLRLSIGSDADQTTELRMTGGTLTMRDSQGIRVGLAGSGRIRQLGGTVNTPRLELNGPTDETASYELRGGLLDLRGALDDVGGGESSFLLRGGTLASNLITSAEVDSFLFDYQAADAALIWGAFSTSTTFHVRQDLRLAGEAGHTATFDLRGGTLQVDGDVTDGPGESRLLIKDGTLTAGGDVTIDQIDLSGGQLAGSGGTLTINDPSPTALNFTGGTLKNFRTIDGTLVHEGGTLMIGASPGTMTITGDYLLSDQGSGGTWFVEIGGTTAGVDHDKLEVGQTAALDGTLSLELINDFIPSVGDRFDILDFTAASGDLTLDPSLAPLPEGLAWNLDDLLTTGELFVSSSLLTLPGDYSGNGIVDGADLLVWQKNLGSSVVLPNDDTPGAVTQADLDIWSTNFGNLATPQSSSVAIPEPSSATSSLILLLILMGGLGKNAPRPLRQRSPTPAVGSLRHVPQKDPRRLPSGVLRLVP